jgi:mRNA interferase RelE/StbE
LKEAIVRRFRRKAGWLVRFRIFETDQFIEDITGNFEARGKRLSKKISEYVYPHLRNNPYFGKNIKKLKNYKPETWRYRIGNFRFFYTIDDKKHIVFMITADSRKDIYR